MLRNLSAGAVLCAVLLTGGCSQPPMTCPQVLFVDGAGWFTGDGPVRQGLKEADYPGPVVRFGWSSGAGPLDHALAGPDHPKVDALAGRITDLRRANPDGQIVVMGLSAGSVIIVYALEILTPDIQVDEVVLLSPSISGRTDLREALSHVKGGMYVTVNPDDALLAVGTSAGPEPGEPAGRMGFVTPADAAMDLPGESLYRKVEHILWKKEFAAMGWKGGHVGPTSSEFIRQVIAPKIMPRNR